MITFTPYENASHFLFISILYVLTILLFWNKNIKYYDSVTSKQPFLIVLVLVHLLFAFDGGDFYHYYVDVINRDYSAMEPVYAVLGRLVGQNYLLFRLIIWGTALWLFMLTAKRFGVDSYKATYLMYLMFITIFDYARATLGMAVFFYGISFICMPKYTAKVWSYILGVALVLLSIVFHRSMFFCVAISFIVFIPLNKKTIIFVLLLFMGSAPLLTSVYNSLLAGSLVSNVSIYEKILEYSQNESVKELSRYEWIRRYMEYATFFIPVIIAFFRLLKEPYEVSDYKQYGAMKKLFNVALAIQMLAVSTLIMDLESFTLFYRYLYMSMIPVVILLCYMRDEKMISSKAFYSLIILSLVGKFFGIAKRFLGGNLA